jgi:hypothetical protein
MLFHAMALYSREIAIGHVVKNYGNGLLMLKAANRSCGRCLFFAVEHSDETVLIALLAYKKGSNEVPANLLATARKRRQQYLSQGGD